MDHVVLFDQNLGNALENLVRYRKLIEKLIHLIITMPYATSFVGLLIQYMQIPHQLHWYAACRLL